MRAAAAGDQRAWHELVDEFGGLIWRVARAHRLSPTDAADVSQATWMRLVEHLDAVHDPARVGAWLVTVARRESIARLRARQPLPVGDELPERPGDDAPPCAALLAQERDRALAAALADVPARDRMLLSMLMADPAPTYAEIGAALGMPIGSIGPTRARALERLRRVARRHGICDADW
ncbi:MAG TPA: sigma-70 family RNA polymerase sigma factor [Solirubrobacteraceae bacterium]|nr:sigma-70 family RNA polymerase sigma factor [Solirubrobacteraceae bacterium]